MQTVGRASVIKSLTDDTVCDSERSCFNPAKAKPPFVTSTLVSRLLAPPSHTHTRHTVFHYARITTVEPRWVVRSVLPGSYPEPSLWAWVVKRANRITSN